jgi:hypothetical protein
MEQKKYWGKTVASFFLVLCTMPLGHALMKIMESAMPATFGIWMMFMVVYLFNTRSGCHAYNWLQKVLFRGKRHETVIR